MALDGVSALALLLLSSFVIERVVSAVLFVLPTLGMLGEPEEKEDDRAHAARERKITYARFFFSAALAAAVLTYWQHLRILELFGQPREYLGRELDFAVTWVVLLGGADRIAAVVKLPSAASAPAAKPEPLEVKGHLTLDDSRPVR